MSERSSFRPRKVVDYSKFVDNDSDSDDFSLPIAKKSKSSKAETSQISNSKLPKCMNDKTSERKDCVKKDAIKTSNNVVKETKAEVKPEVCIASRSAVETKSSSKSIEESDGSDSRPKSTPEEKCESAAEDSNSSDELKDQCKLKKLEVHQALNPIESHCSRVKWKPPANLKSAAITNKTKSPVSPSTSTLRVGLSRNARTKPLHSNVKMQS
ncbi:hypothetical protein CHUAL_011950 [Chamberlinius hualienensis]